jgi:hypothetical protein
MPADENEKASGCSGSSSAGSSSSGYDEKGE